MPWFRPYSTIRGHGSKCRDTGAASVKLVPEKATIDGPDRFRITLVPLLNTIP